MIQKMQKFDKTFEENLEKTIADIEEKTSVEVVVAITPNSDSYVDAYFKGGLLALIVMLLFLFYSPVFFSETFVPLDLAGAFGVGALIVWLFPPVKRRLVSDKRKEKYVNAGANSYFLENNLDETIERTAFLVYMSVFEKKCRLIADKGILAVLPAGIWKEIELSFQKEFSKNALPQTILEILPKVTRPFSEYLPPAEDNIDELPNRLRRVEC
jgi:putative membrane protein